MQPESSMDPGEISIRKLKEACEIFQHQIFSNSLNIHSIQPSNDFMSVKKFDHFSSSREKGFLMSQRVVVTMDFGRFGKKDVSAKTWRRTFR